MSIPVSSSSHHHHLPSAFLTQLNQGGKLTRARVLACDYPEFRIEIIPLEAFGYSKTSEPKLVSWH